jgi:hypothetical protein
VQGNKKILEKEIGCHLSFVDWEKTKLRAGNLNYDIMMEMME